ncbi:MAG: hypothetical protein H6727_17850 [Myxococcales bacterium]|nr:hypothetical protein [Myxococcales bacterium]
MFERYWKPHLDKLALKANERIERVVQSGPFLRTTSGLLGNVMRGLRRAEDARELLLAQVGVAMRSNQLRVMHGVQRLLAHIEDLKDDLRAAQQRRSEDVAMLRGMIESLQEQVAQLQQQLQQTDQKMLEEPSSQALDAHQEPAAAERSSSNHNAS